MPTKDKLGRGLGAMFPHLSRDIGEKSNFLQCGVEELCPNRFQPRKTFRDSEQKKLVASVREKGIIQPIVVRRIESGYEIIAGERRWRAAQTAGLQEVPIVVRDAADADMAEISLIENLQREDLNPLEEAEAYQTLMDRFGMSQDSLSTRVGRDRSTIANTLRLLRLPPEVKKELADRRLTEGHARALLALESVRSQVSVLKDVLRKGLSVRETERLVKALSKTAAPVRKAARTDGNLVDLERRLSSRLLAKVRIRQGKNSGAIEIAFGSPQELDRLIRFLLDAAG
ncbi:MAG: putative chromosome-partitioning protein ParB [Syntrophaceae bacterium PtaU1.Bin231]|nr:MAG: putative chromosome-partitioning protein ParB [Syntrophaceae bacterium PtaU1.Bin231]HOG15847.1 ParB/RepB/Spo0J family partition protein [Syntrophales bacterium]